MTIKLINPNLFIGGLALLLAACSSGEQAPPPPTPSPAASPTAPAAAAAKAQHNTANKGGQVVESGKYHLELVPEKSANETHLDLYVQSGESHQDISDAKVSGEIQSPDGQQKPITFSYDAAGKHYAAVLPGKTAGAHQLKVTVNIGNDKADGRFSFDR